MAPATERAATLLLAGVAVVFVLGSITVSGASVLHWSSVATALVAAGAAAVGMHGRAVALAVAAALLSIATWSTPTEGTDLARGLAIALPPLALAFAGLSVHAARSVGSALVIAGAVVAGPVRALFDDPFLDAACRGCRHSALAVWGDLSVVPLVSLLGSVLIVVGLALGIARSRQAVLTVAVAVIAAAGAPFTGLPATGVAAAACAVAALASLLSTGRLLRGRRRLVELDDASRSAAGLLSLLRRALRDPGVTIDYARITTEGLPVQFVTAQGEPAPPISESVTEPVRIGGALVARIHRGPRARGAAQLDAILSPQLLISVESQRLAATLAAHVNELAESRARVVRQADEERRRLERDLHDGAQQHVLALGFDLRTALAEHPDAEARDVLERCLASTMLALDELRDISHGVYPPLLSAAGLAPALHALGRASSVALESDLDLPGRMPTSVERVAYLLVAECLERSSSDLVVRGRITDGQLVISVGSPGAEPSALMRERVAALGGTIEAEDDTCTLTLPCE